MFSYALRDDKCLLILFLTRTCLQGILGDKQLLSIRILFGVLCFSQWPWQLESMPLTARNVHVNSPFFWNVLMYRIHPIANTHYSDFRISYNLTSDSPQKSILSSISKKRWKIKLLRDHAAIFAVSADHATKFWGDRSVCFFCSSSHIVAWSNFMSSQTRHR